MPEPQALSSICGYPVLETLSPGGSYVAQMGSRRIVLKRLEADCLISGESRLHPTIRDRLQRLQQLADMQVANLLGVERDVEQRECAYLVWEHVEGQSLEEWSKRVDINADDFASMARELMMCVSRLHEWGIVHGDIHCRNVIVDAIGKIKLTHVSPLLYSDPQADVVALAELFFTLAEHRAEAKALSEIASRLLEPKMTLRMISAQPAGGDDAKDNEAPVGQEQAGAALRLRTAGGVAIMVLAMLLMATILGRWVGRQRVEAPAPPDATGAALRP